MSGSAPDRVSGSAPPALRLLAPAKINLVFEVLRRRSDGYHEIDSVLTTLDLGDRVRLRPSREGLEVRLDGPYAAGIDPADDLSGRAARALAEAAGRAPDVRIEVTKRIPVAAGLGGGSSDAGAVLRGLNELWELGWPPERLAEVAATVGSDVPFFLHGGTARCTGRGERVEPLRDLLPLRLLVLVPPLGDRPDKTARRYGSLTARDYSNGERSRRLAGRVDRGAPPPARDFVNAFETAIERTDAELIAHYAAYSAAGAAQLHLCGAGPAVFLLVHAAAKAAALRRDFERAGADVLEARTLPRAAALASQDDA